MKTLYQANDGKIFENEFDCLQHENGINKPLFEKSKFFTSCLSESEEFQSNTTFFYIHPDEWDKMRVYLRTKNRTLRKCSKLGIYESHNMELTPIEEIAETTRKRLREIQKTIKKENEIIKRILEKVEDQKQ